MSLREKHGSAIDEIIGRYAQKRSAVIPLLYIAQDEYGRLTDGAIREVADILDMPATDVFEVVGFYTLLYDDAVGTWVLQVCDDVPCCFCGAEELITALEQTLGIRCDQTTSDKMFTLQRVKCVASCNKAPVLQANLNFHYNVTPDKITDLLNDLRRQANANQAISVSGRLAEV
jgi:NADH-quinone oxidoreductase subunit E